MGSHMNFKNFGCDACPGVEGSDPKPPTGDFPLVRQSSIYSLTFDEFQNTLGGVGKDFGSMNMDEFLKNIWTAEESQAMNSSAMGVQGSGSVVGGNLQRQGSLTLPRTLSQKTVDEVWRDLIKDSSNSGGTGGSNMPQRQQTLGEMTLEEFLVRAGVVREDNNTQQMGTPNNNVGFYSNNNIGLALSFHQQAPNNGLLGNNNSTMPNQPPGFGIHMGGISQQPQQQQQQQQTLCPKQANISFSPAMNLVNNNLVGVGDNAIHNNLVGLGTGVTVATASPGTSSAENTSSLSPVPYVFGRGRRSNAALEKVIERRQRRMIKNRESAARSRARKQAYTLELEAEVAKLKELNEELQRKQAEMMEMQKNQLKEPINRPLGGKRQCLRRTLTGPW